jgi:hypothetical protein
MVILPALASLAYIYIYICAITAALIVSIRSPYKTSLEKETAESQRTDGTHDLSQLPHATVTALRDAG